MTNDVSNWADAADTISLKTRRAIAAALIDSVMDGHAFLALTGPARVGKTTVASAACNELIDRSVRVLRIGRGDNDSLSLRTIVSQLPARSDVGSDDNDIGERLFDVLTVRDAPGQKVVLVIDDAELLQPDALSYLCLMSSLPMGMLPQVLLVGRPEFWSTTLHAAPSNIAELITARWELELLSPDEVRDCVAQMVTSLGQTGADLFASSGLDALVRSSNGLPGRIAALLPHALAIQHERHISRLTPAVIDDAAAMLDAGVSAPPLDTGMRSLHCEPACATLEDVMPVPDGRRDAIDDHGVTDRPPWMVRFTRAAVLAVVLLTAGVVAYWRVSPHADTADVPATPVEAASTVAGAVLPGTHGLTVSRPVQAEAGTELPTFAPDTDTMQDGPAAGQPAMSSPVATSEAAVAPPASSAEAATDPTTLPIRSDALMAASTNAMPAIARPQISDASKTQQVAQRDRPSDQASLIQSDAPNQSATGLLGATITQAALAGIETVEHAAPPALSNNQTIGAPSPITPPAITQAPNETIPSTPPAETRPTEGQAVTEPVAADATAISTVGAAAGPASIASTAGMAPPASADVTRGDQPKSAQSAAAPPRYTSPDVTLLLSRGEAMLSLGDISAARLLYERAAALGSVRAATTVGKTFDPAFLATIHASGILPDPAASASWYRKGAALGDSEAADRLARLTAAR